MIIGEDSIEWIRVGEAKHPGQTLTIFTEVGEHNAPEKLIAAFHFQAATNTTATPSNGLSLTPQNMICSEVSTTKAYAQITVHSQLCTELMATT